MLGKVDEMQEEVGAINEPFIIEYAIITTVGESKYFSLADIAAERIPKCIRSAFFATIKPAVFTTLVSAFWPAKLSS